MLHKNRRFEPWQLVIVEDGILGLEGPVDREQIKKAWVEKTKLYGKWAPDLLPRLNAARNQAYALIRKQGAEREVLQESRLVISNADKIFNYAQKSS